MQFRYTGWQHSLHLTQYVFTVTGFMQLQQFPLFAGLAPEQLDAILRMVTVEAFIPGEIIVRTGDGADRINLLQRGRAKMYVVSAQGQEKIMCLFHPSDVFGGFLSGMHDEEFLWVQAVDDVVVSSMDESAFRRFIQDFPDLCVNLVHYLAARHAADLRRLNMLLHTRASYRLVLTLLDLGDRWGQGADWFSSRQVNVQHSGFKVLVEEGSDRVLGAHLLGPHAEEVINLFALAVRLGLRTADLKQVVYAYPTSASDIGSML